MSDVPPPLHLPEPSPWPATLALAVALIGAGVLLHIVLAIAGALLGVVAIAAWVADLRRERRHDDQEKAHR
jgi:hypothetical protein